MIDFATFELEMIENSDPHEDFLDGSLFRARASGMKSSVGSKHERISKSMS